MPIRKILNKDDLLEIAEFFMEKGYGNNVTVNIELPDQKTMSRVNEDYYYKLNQDAKNSEANLEEIEELNINIGGVKFKYFVKNEIK